MFGTESEEKNNLLESTTTCYIINKIHHFILNIRWEPSTCLIYSFLNKPVKATWRPKSNLPQWQCLKEAPGHTAVNCQILSVKSLASAWLQTHTLFLCSHQSNLNFEEISQIVKI